jgi:GNAT superfamily N-acetyltransferase
VTDTSPAAAADPSSTIRIRRAAPDDADFEVAAAVFAAVDPDDGRGAPWLRWAHELHPGAAIFLAEDEAGRTVGVADVGRIFVLPAEYDAYWTSMAVLPAARRRGIGSALLGATSGVARDAGKAALETQVRADRPESVEFLHHRGFTVIETSKAVRLDLAGLPAPNVAPPAGIRLVTLAERPDLVPGVHAVAVEAFPDIPGSEPMAAGDLAEFRARDIDAPDIRPDAFFVAVDESDRVVGYANVTVAEARPDVGGHDMTAVLREARGRGIAGALKRATIAWAIRNGLVALETTNDIQNAPMRTINQGLGYRPLPDRYLMRGPLAPTAEEPR